jgi:hypothetical protein
MGTQPHADVIAERTAERFGGRSDVELRNEKGDVADARSHGRARVATKRLEDCSDAEHWNERKRPCFQQ